MPKTGKRGRSASKIPSAVPKSIKYGFHLDTQKFRWTLRYCIWEHDGWKNTSIEKLAEIVCKLQDFEKQTWGEIKKASGGKSEGHGNNNHSIPITELPKREMKLITGKGYKEQYDKVFSLRLTSLERLIGFVDMDELRILWFDPEHKIFPSNK